MKLVSHVPRNYIWLVRRLWAPQEKIYKKELGVVRVTQWVEHLLCKSNRIPVGQEQDVVVTLVISALG